MGDAGSCSFSPLPPPAAPFFNPCRHMNKKHEESERIREWTAMDEVRKRKMKGKRRGRDRVEGEENEK